MFVNFRPLLRISSLKSIYMSHGFPEVFSRCLFTSPLRYRNYRSPIKFTKRIKITEEDELEDDDVTEENVVDDEELNHLLERTFLLPDSGHQVLVIQPFIKWGRKKKRNTTPQLQLLESVTLIKTLRQWKVVDEMIISLPTFDKITFFGKGNLELLKDKIRNSPYISAIFISANTLRLQQQFTLEEIFGVPVFDRYTIIMHIFKEHAQTKEAKLQVQLAQLPYLRRVLKGINLGIGSKLGVSGRYIGGEGPKLLADRKEVFKAREAKLKKEILQLRKNREIARKIRDKHDLPVVAVVGYTNSGKTSLIKALTGKKTLEPQDYLFATLDVTSHLGELPSGLKAFFVDTLGFITDIPTYFIESFLSTLEDATCADLLIHVRDISHPDTVAQNDNVINTLETLNLSETTKGNIITVGNKIDLIEKEELRNYQDLILVSCTALTGIDVLRQEVEKRIMMLGDKIRMIIRVKTGGVEYDWLHEQATVVEENPDPKNNEYMLISTIISLANLAKFKHNFIMQYKQS